MFQDTIICRSVRSCSRAPAEEQQGKVTQTVMARGRSSLKKNGIMRLGWITSLLGTTRQCKVGSRGQILRVSVSSRRILKVGTVIGTLLTTHWPTLMEMENGRLGSVSSLSIMHYMACLAPSARRSRTVAGQVIILRWGVQRPLTPMSTG